EARAEQARPREAGTAVGEAAVVVPWAKPAAEAAASEAARAETVASDPLAVLGIRGDRRRRGGRRAVAELDRGQRGAAACEDGDDDRTGDQLVLGGHLRKGGCRE